MSTEDNFSSITPSHLDLDNDSESTNPNKSHKAIIKLKMRPTLPSQIPMAIIQQAGKMDALPSGWQKTFEPHQDNCEVSNGKLDSSKAIQDSVADLF